MKRHSERKAENAKRTLAQLIVSTIVALVLVALLILAHRDKGKQEGTLRPGAAAVPPAPANDEVLIEVNGEAIHASEYQAAIASFPEQMRGALASPAARAEIAKRLVQMKLLAQEAQRLNLTSKPELRGTLAINQLQILAAAALQDLVKKEGALDLRKYYDENRDKFERLKFRQILIAVEGGEVPPKSGTAPSEAAAKAKADAIVRQLRGGTSFAQLAAESDDPGAAERGGDMGSVRRGMLPADIESFVFALQPRQISDPLRTRYGYHIFQVTERGTESFDEMRMTLLQQEPSLRAEKVVDGLMEKAVVKLDPKFFGKATLQ